MPKESQKIQTEYGKWVERLYNMAPSFQKVGASAYHPGLESMSDFAAFLGNPHQAFKTIHIAGTNGKGSVAHMLASALAAAYPGERIGLYTSPHLVDFRERIKVVSTALEDDGRCYGMIGEDQVVDFLDRTERYIEEHSPSFFEITTAMAFDFFRSSKVKMAVIETGLGGRLDSTNIIMPELSIITSVGIDHKDILGDTLEKIAWEKAGILKPGVPVVTGRLCREAMNIVSGRAADLVCSLHRCGELCDEFARAEDTASEADLRSDCQIWNIKTVFTALSVLGAGPVKAGSAAYRAITHAARMSGLRGRWEKLQAKPDVICDIGHNVEAMRVSMKQLVKEADGRHVIMVLGMAGDKDVWSVSRLFPLSCEYIFTQAKGSRAMPALELQRIVETVLDEVSGNRCIIPSEIVPDVGDAVSHALVKASPDDLVFIGGSSYVVAEAIGCFEAESC